MTLEFFPAPIDHLRAYLNKDIFKDRDKSPIHFEIKDSRFHRTRFLTLSQIIIQTIIVSLRQTALSFTQEITVWIMFSRQTIDKIV